MPHKKDLIHLPDWVEAIGDDCLRTTVVEGLYARWWAVKFGALEHPKCRAAIESADKTLDRIADGRVAAGEACKKAATALRKYNTASECTHPTARRD